MARSTDYYTVLSFSFYHYYCTFNPLIEMLINRWCVLVFKESGYSFGLTNISILSNRKIRPIITA